MRAMEHRCLIGKREGFSDAVLSTGSFHGGFIGTSRVGFRPECLLLLSSSTELWGTCTSSVLFDVGIYIHTSQSGPE